MLLIEDSPSDTELTIEAMRSAKLHNHLSCVEDGVKALEFLRRQGIYAQAPRPDLIWLDLNLPRKDGRALLVAVTADENLKDIPVVVLTSLPTNEDVLCSYNLHASCHIIPSQCNLRNLLRS